MGEVSFEQDHALQHQTLGETVVTRKKQPSRLQRQSLSCTKCRERKVKCDRTKPCSACCVRGLPRDCHFITEDGNYTPIQQSYELRKLRAENVQLKERFRALGIPIYDEEFDHTSPLGSHTDNVFSPAGKRPSTKQTLYQDSGWQNSIYFGAPGLATVISDFSSDHFDNRTTLAHIIPRPKDIFTSEDTPAYAFATLFSASSDECIPQLLSCLPAKHELTEYMNVFEHSVSIHIPVEVSTFETERFLLDAESNSHSCPSMLALILAVIALGAQHSIWGRNGSCDVAKMEAEAQKVAASMQALRLASFMHKPSLVAVQTLILIGKYLANSGKFLDAFILFGTTIRSAHSIGLHCNPKHLTSCSPTEAEVATRQKIWWYMLRIDEEYSMTFGRPLGISSIGTCCWPQVLTTDPNVLRLGDFIIQFTVLARQILRSDRLTDPQIDEFTKALCRLLDTMPETLQFDPAWTDTESPPSQDLWSLRTIATVFHCKAHTYLILLNRQRTHRETFDDQQISRDATPHQQTMNHSCSNSPSPALSPRGCIRGRTIVVASSKDILSAFQFLHQKNPSVLIDWSIGQQAFNSCMLLLFDAIEYQRITDGVLKAEQTLSIFKELEENSVHKLARIAVEKISRALQTLHDLVAQSSQGNSESYGWQRNHTFGYGAGKNGVSQDWVGIENVMGNTGMQLLETYDLRTPYQETFNLISWDTPGSFKDHSNQHVTQQWEQNDMSKSRPRNQDDRKNTSISHIRCVTPSPNDHTLQKYYTAPASHADPTQLPPQPPKIIATHHTHHCNPIRPLPPQAPDATPFSAPFFHKSWTNEKPTYSKHKNFTTITPPTIPSTSLYRANKNPPRTSYRSDATASTSQYNVPRPSTLGDIRHMNYGKQGEASHAHSMQNFHMANTPNPEFLDAAMDVDTSEVVWEKYHTHNTNTSLYLPNRNTFH
ncbi:hypothetical protein PSV08DRAFT_347476 [Bipolaris maydis]|uniref:uncharacterized protein n=1 Tax=Cochliobolus heterostrophus TaxID=5016 RepID=UPI0024DD754E|nr:hypothetical protein J3E73DRAFT_365767 [Bipolaris maydis]KAJ6274723.1 hypothetical protein PSV08DRAFT_347476 [Bipolaris maydis]KAJ6285995.1 hypothetical protein J3E71DRAFT_338134 [Bipolaris maydis]